MLLTQNPSVKRECEAVRLKAAVWDPLPNQSWSHACGWAVGDPGMHPAPKYCPSRVRCLVADTMLMGSNEHLLLAAWWVRCFVRQSLSLA